MAELLSEFEPEIESVSLAPSDGGRFEIVLNDNLVYSKLKTNRHPQPGEVSELMRKLLQEGK